MSLVLKDMSVQRKVTLGMICAGVILVLLPVEIGEFEMETIGYYLLWLSIVPGIIMPIMTSGDSIGAIIGVLVLFGYVGVTCFMGLMFMMCAWTDDGIAYVNRNSESVRIIKRSYGCGAWDGSSPIRTLYKERKLIGNIRWVREVEEARIDTSEWRKVE